MLAGLPFAASSDFESASNAYKNRNYPVAFEEFSWLADAGDPRAQTVLGIMYNYGESVTLDLQKAYGWYMKAAEQGYAPAQFNVGSMLIDGDGVIESREEGLLWLTRAAESGYERANDRLAELKGSEQVLNDEEPIAWSQSWNLRLPNVIREDVAPVVNSSLQVYRVQLGAMSTLEGAERLWRQLSANNGDLFTGRQPIFRRASSRGRDIVRVQMGPFDEKSTADTFCQRYRLHFKNNGCLVLLTH